MHGSPRWPWGKLERDESGRLVRWQSLAEHSHDVAHVFRALLLLPGIRSRLSKLAGTELHDLTIERLSYLVYLHDFGKVNSGFQARANPASPVVGHIAPLAAICGQNADRRVCERALLALGADRFESWGDGIIPLFDAILSHHGRPWPRDGDGRLFARHWQPSGEYDPIGELARLRAAADVAFPAAVSSAQAILPSVPGFTHAIAGLVQLADWIGSSGWTRDHAQLTAVEWSREILREIGLDPSPSRARVLEQSIGFESVFERKPYPHQATSGEGSSRLLILEAETGAGKTEAALWRFLRLFSAGEVDGLYFALPTRTAAAQLHGRVERMAKSLWGVNAPPTVMAVPGYLSDDSRGGLPRASDELDGPESDRRSPTPWAAEHPKRFFSAMISVGTIDQALLCALRVKHAHLRASCLMRHLLVVDEVHASDAYMQRILAQLLRDHLAAGGHAMLLSATLGAEVRNSLMAEAAGGRARDAVRVSFETAAAVAYPLITDLHSTTTIVPTEQSRFKAIHMRAEPLLDEPQRVAGLALEAAKRGAKVLVVRNTVAGAVAVQRALEAEALGEDTVLFRVAGRCTLHHGRFAREDRRLLDAAVEAAVGLRRPTGGLVVVGTQTLEQSLDIDADLLITDLCPIDVLLQRLGRLHRHVADASDTPRIRPGGFESPSCAVLVPPNGLTEFLPSRRNGGGDRHGLGHSQVLGIIRGVYPDLTILEATRRLVVSTPLWTIPSMNRWLVESGIHRDALDALVETLPQDERDEWSLNRRRVQGDELAQVGTASGNVLRKDREFMDQPLDDAERIGTRLGANDRLIRLPDGTVGPFGSGITQITVPNWMLRDVDADAALSIAPASASADLGLTIGAKQFVYGAHGLHPVMAKS